MNDDTTLNSAASPSLPESEEMEPIVEIDVDVDEEHEQIEVRYGFRVDDFGILLASAISIEIIDDLPMYPVPNTSSWLRGIINLRGNLVPIIDLGQYFDFTHDNNKKLQILVFDKDEKAVGLNIYERPVLLDRITQTSDLPDLPEDFEDHVMDAYTQDDIVWLDIDFNGFFRTLGNKTASY